MAEPSEQQYTYSNKRVAISPRQQRKAEKKKAKIEKIAAKMERVREKREAGKFRKIPVLGSIIRAVTFEFPKSVSDAVIIDLVQGGISLLPVAGDLLIDTPRTIRYSIDPEIPASARAKVVAISIGDEAIGIIPVAGDIIDFAFLSNTLSYAVVQKARGEKLNMFRRRKIKLNGNNDKKISSKIEDSYGKLQDINEISKGE